MPVPPPGRKLIAHVWHEEGDNLTAVCGWSVRNRTVIEAIVPIVHLKPGDYTLCPQCPPVPDHYIIA